jgi:Lar family restriction alleviation protein
MTERCVCCGAIIPEGQQTCPSCKEKKGNALKSCPFCGGKKIGYSIKTATSNYQRIYHAAMYCAKCHCYGARVLIRPVEHSRISVERNESYKRKAIEAWNRRVE